MNGTIKTVFSHWCFTDEAVTTQSRKGLPSLSLEANSRARSTPETGAIAILLEAVVGETKSPFLLGHSL